MAFLVIFSLQTPYVRSVLRAVCIFTTVNGIIDICMNNVFFKILKIAYRFGLRILTVIHYSKGAQKCEQYPQNFTFHMSSEVVAAFASFTQAVF